MKSSIRAVAAGLLLVITSLVLVGCAAGADASSMTPVAEEPAESLPEGNLTEGQDVVEGSVEVVYFHTANPCDCMAVFGEAIADSINANFEAELASGELKFIDVVSDDAANKEIVEAFDSQPSDLFVGIRIGDVTTAEPDYEIWNLMGDDEAVAKYVKGVVEAKLAGMNS